MGQNKFSYNKIGKLKKIHLELLIKMHDSIKLLILKCSLVTNFSFVYQLFKFHLNSQK